MSNESIRTNFYMVMVILQESVTVTTLHKFSSLCVFKKKIKKNETFFGFFCTEFTKLTHSNVFNVTIKSSDGAKFAGQCKRTINESERWCGTTAKRRETPKINDYMESHWIGLVCCIQYKAICNSLSLNAQNRATHFNVYAQLSNAIVLFCLAFAIVKAITIFGTNVYN